MSKPDGLWAFESGQIAQALSEVSRGGSRFLATGEIRPECLNDFKALAKRCGGGLQFDYRDRDGGARIEWRASPFEWSLAALRWLDSAEIGEVEWHWIQGLLFGYSPRAIGEFLAAMPSESGPSRSHGSGILRRPVLLQIRRRFPGSDLNDGESLAIRVCRELA